MSKPTKVELVIDPALPDEAKEIITEEFNKAFSDNNALSEKVVHYSDYASQPDIHLACDRWTIPAWGEPSSSILGIYLEDERGEFYTFERTDKVTCPGCLKYLRAKERP